MLGDALAVFTLVFWNAAGNPRLKVNVIGKDRSTEGGVGSVGAGSLGNKCQTQNPAGWVVYTWGWGKEMVPISNFVPGCPCLSSSCSIDESKSFTSQLPLVLFKWLISLLYLH